MILCHGFLHAKCSFPIPAARELSVFRSSQPDTEVYLDDVVVYSNLWVDHLADYMNVCVCVCVYVCVCD